MELPYFCENFSSNNLDSSFICVTHTKPPVCIVDSQTRKIFFSSSINSLFSFPDSTFSGRRKEDYCAFPSCGISNMSAKGCCIPDNSSTTPAMSITFHATAQRQRKWTLQMKRQLIDSVFGMLHSCNTSKTTKMDITNGAAIHRQRFWHVTFRATPQKQRKWALQMERQLIDSVFCMLHSVLPFKNNENEHYKWSDTSSTTFLTCYIPRFLSTTTKMSITNEAAAHRQRFWRVTFRATPQKQRKWALQMERQLNNNVFGLLHLTQQTTVAGNKILQIIQNTNSRFSTLLHFIQFSIRRKIAIFQSCRSINYPFIACLKGIKPSLL